MVVGEAGFPRNEFLHDLRWWEITAIIDGYRRRERTFCIMTRWSTFMQMLTGMSDLKAAGIFSAEDLMHFPWEVDGDHPDEEEIAKMREELQEANRKRSEENISS